MNNQAEWTRNRYGRLERSHISSALGRSDLALCEVLHLVCDFLTPRDLYNTLFASNQLMKSIDQEDIVRNTLCNGNLPMKNTIENLYDLTLHGKIYLPSCARLSRLVNAKRCEICNLTKIKQVRPDYGMALCFDCLRTYKDGTVYTAELLVEPPGDRILNIGLNEIISHPRVTTRMFGYYNHLKNGATNYTHHKWHDRPNGERHFIWKKPLLDKQGRRKKIGPIITQADISTITKMKRMEEFESYITKTLQADALSKYGDFNDAVRQYRSTAYNNYKRRKEIRIANKEKADDRRRLKLRKVERWVRELKQIFHHFCPEVKHLLQYRINRRYLRYGPNATVYYSDEEYSHLHIIHFRDREVHRLLSDYISAPSRVIGRKIKHLTGRIYRLYQQRTQQGTLFRNLSFSSFESSDTESELGGPEPEAGEEENDNR
jgi:hypothetical protein